MQDNDPRGETPADSHRQDLPQPAAGDSSMPITDVIVPAEGKPRRDPDDDEDRWSITREGGW